jgi:hypothetical protein
VFVVDPEPGHPSLLLRNCSSSGHWLAVAAPVGAAVELYGAGSLGDPEALVGRAEVLAGTGNAAGDPPVVHLGLGDVDAVDLRARLPGGEVVEQRDVTADQTLCVAASGC